MNYARYSFLLTDVDPNKIENSCRCQAVVHFRVNNEPDSITHWMNLGIEYSYYQ